MTQQALEDELNAAGWTGQTSGLAQSAADHFNAALKRAYEAELAELALSPPGTRAALAQFYNRIHKRVFGERAGEQ